MSSIENNNGVHSNERLQVTKNKDGSLKSKAQQYAEYHKLDWSMCDSDKVEDVNVKGKVKILEEKN